MMPGRSRSGRRTWSIPVGAGKVRSVIPCAEDILERELRVVTRVAQDHDRGFGRCQDVFDDGDANPLSLEGWADRYRRQDEDRLA